MKESEITTNELNDLLNTLHTHFGYDFTGYARSSIRRRLARFMAANRIGSVSGLLQQVPDNKTLSEDLINDISVTVTELFRDPSFYLHLREKILPRLATYPVIRIWVAGCATGEEAYSLAILLKEEGLLERSVIYATDINKQSIATAQRGIYPLASMQHYTENYLKAGGKSSLSDYYLAKYGSVMLDKQLQRKIVFSTHNLVSDAAFNEFQLITCRNVLIYFNPALQSKVVNLLYDSLCPLGFLCLGNRESLLFSERKKLFDEVSRRERIFIKKSMHHH